MFRKQKLFQLVLSKTKPKQRKTLQGATKMKKEWILVVDGSKAKIMKIENNSLVHVFPTYHPDEMVTPLDRDPSKLGRVHESHEIMRHSHSPHVDYKDSVKQEFIKKICDIVNDNIEEYDCLTIVAPAERLGEIRDHLTETVKEKVTQEINKDLVKAPLEEVYRYIDGELIDT